MASSSKTINMPLMFAISIGAAVSLVATTMFGLAWYEYEAKVVLREQVFEGEDGKPAPMHDASYERAKAAELENLGDIDAAILSVAAEHVKDKPADHEGHGEGHGAE